MFSDVKIYNYLIFSLQSIAKAHSFVSCGSKKNHDVFKNEIKLY